MVKDMGNDDQKSRMLTVREVGPILHIHSNTVRRWSDRGIIKAYRIGPRGDRRFKWEDVAVLLIEETEDSLANAGNPTSIDKYKVFR